MFLYIWNSIYFIIVKDNNCLYIGGGGCIYKLIYIGIMYMYFYKNLIKSFI